MTMHSLQCSRISRKLCCFYNLEAVTQSAIVAVKSHHIHHQTWMLLRNFSGMSISISNTHTYKEPLLASYFVHNASQLRGKRSLSFADRLHSTNSEEEVEPPVFKPFYRLPSIVGLRILSRVKIAQTGFTLALLPPLYHYHTAGIITLQQVEFSVGMATFALFMLYAMSFYLRRVIGAMYLHRKGHVIKVSHLNFWGSRRETLIPTADVVPLTEGTNKASEVLLRLERYSSSDVLYFSLRFGLLFNMEAFEEVFGKPKGFKTYTVSGKTE